MPAHTPTRVPTPVAAVLGLVAFSTLASCSAPSAVEALLHAGGEERSVADGHVPDGATVLDDELPAVSNLDPALRAALRRAARDAIRHGIRLGVNSGWRSRGYQEQLLDEAVGEHGSPEEAARWVATPDTSPHVSGDAVDIGGHDATAWLSQHGAAHGLCQVYDNEPWHFELSSEAAVDGCPDAYDDPTQDPRMQ